MLSSFVALIAIARLQEPPQVPTAGAVISKMLSRYSALTSLTGRIRLTVTTMNVSTSLDTTVQFEKPSYVLVKQESHGDPSGKWLIVRDGRHFSYNVPRNLPGPKDDRLL